MEESKYTFTVSGAPVKVRKMTEEDVPVSVKYLEDFLCDLNKKIEEKGIRELEDGRIVKKRGIAVRKSVYGGLLKYLKENGVLKRNGVPACVSEDGKIITYYGIVVFWDDAQLYS